MNLSTQNNSVKRRGLTIREMTVFAVFAALMYCSKILMQALPNIHLLGMLIMALTVVFRAKALVPIYIYILLDGLTGGFSLWWIPYLYIWAVLWGVTMLIPRNMPKKAKYIIYPVVCCLHGLSFGLLYAPAQAIMFKMSFEQTLAWVAAGFPFDLIHGVSNLFTGLLVLPLSGILKKLMNK